MKAAIIRYKLERAAASVEWALGHLREARAEGDPRDRRIWIEAAQTEVTNARAALDRAKAMLDAEWAESKAREEGEG